MSTLKEFNKNKKLLKQEIAQCVATYLKANPDQLYTNAIFYLNETMPLKETIEKYPAKDILVALKSMEEDNWIKNVKHTGEKGLFHFKVIKHMLLENEEMFELKKENYSLFLNKLSNIKMHTPHIYLISRTDIARQLGISLNESLYIVEDLECLNLIDFPANVMGETKERIRIKESLLDYTEAIEDEMNNLSAQIVLTNPLELKAAVKEILTEYGFEQNTISDVHKAISIMSKSGKVGTLLDLLKIGLQTIPGLGGPLAESLSLAQKTVISNKVNKLIP